MAKTMSVIFSDRKNENNIMNNIINSVVLFIADNSLKFYHFGEEANKLNISYTKKISKSIVGDYD
jgi:hypothetical protein